MNWTDHEKYIEILPPIEFNFQECLVFLGRSDQEVLHQIKDKTIFKLIKVNDEPILLKIGSIGHTLRVEFPAGSPSKSIRKIIASYVWELFDLDCNLDSFYEIARNDMVLQQLAEKYYGLRIIAIPDLFEAMTWAIIGQQINLTFAYTLKKRFVENFGEKNVWDGDTFWLYPTFERIASIDVDELRKLQFTTSKAEYVIEVAKAMANGQLSKEKLLQQQEQKQRQKTLLAIRGVGPWTADYVMMKCLHDTSAFPIADVGLHHALKAQLALQHKPTIEQIKEMATNWEGWQAYATFYLWRSLYD